MKNAKTNRLDRGGHKHKARNTSGRDNVREYRLTATWPHRPGPVVYRGPDRARIKATAKGLAAKGGHIVVEQHIEYGVYRVLYEIDGPAILAAREAEARAAAEAEAARAAAELARRAAARRAEIKAQRDRAQAAALMVQPPVPRTPQQRTARHTAGRR